MWTFTREYIPIKQIWNGLFWLIFPLKPLYPLVNWHNYGKSPDITKFWETPRAPQRASAPWDQLRGLGDLEVVRTEIFHHSFGGPMGPTNTTGFKRNGSTIEMTNLVSMEIYKGFPMGSTLQMINFFWDVHGFSDGDRTSVYGFSIGQIPQALAFFFWWPFFIRSLRWWFIFTSLSMKYSLVFP